MDIIVVLFFKYSSEYQKAWRSLNGYQLNIVSWHQHEHTKGNEVTTPPNPIPIFVADLGGGDAQCWGSPLH